MVEKAVRTGARRGIDRRSGERPYRFLATLAHGVNSLLTTRRWSGQDNIPPTGGVLAVANHNSNYDPVAVGEFLIWSGRWPRYLGKSELWNVPVVGYFARGCRQIPVDRTGGHASDSLLAAKKAITEGELVCIYPEGTVGTDPDGWPMTARTGAARLALELRCPVVPVGQWGANQILVGKHVGMPKYFPRKTLQVKAGAPIDLSDLYDADDQHAAVRVASERMMRAITELVAELRGLPVPTDRYDVRKKSRVPLGPTTIDQARPA